MEGEKNNDKDGKVLYKLMNNAIFAFSLLLKLPPRKL